MSKTNRECPPALAGLARPADTAADGRSDWPARCLYVAAAVGLALAVFANDGMFSRGAIRWLVVAVAAALLGLVARPVCPQLVFGQPLDQLILVVALATQFAALLWFPYTAQYQPLGPIQLQVFTMSLTVAALLAGMLCTERPWLGMVVFPLLLGIQVFVGIWLLHHLNMPGIDVLMFQERSAEVLLSGGDPYTISTFPDRYPPALSAQFYGPGISVNGLLQFGYPYAPLTLFLALPGHLLGDVRYASLAAMTLAAALIAYARPGRRSFIAATLLLFSPAFPLMLWLGWTDSYVLLLLAVVWFCQCRYPRLVPYAAGLFLASKQYCPLLAPLLLLLLPRPWTWRALRALALRAIGSALVVSLPLILWNVTAFINSAVTLQFRQPFRPDALSFLAWAKPSHPAAWAGLPFVGLAMMSALVLWLSRYRRITFPAAAALVLLIFFALNKQAFANYYYLVVGAFCCAAAAVEHPVDRNPSDPVPEDQV